MKIAPINSGRLGIEISDFNLASATDTQLARLGELVLENLIVVMRDQKLSPQDEARVCYHIGDIERAPAEIFHRCPQAENGDPVREIQRVTGMKNPDGTPMGLFGHDSDLDWHANRPSAENERKPLIWLYSVFGSLGSRTSWADCAAAYEDLEPSLQEELEELYGIYGFEPGRYTTFTEFKAHRNTDGIRFIRTNQFTKRKGMYFPFLQLFGFKDRDDDYSMNLIGRLREHLMQPKYLYHHDWRDGDVVISEQWLTIHKRWACDVSNRMLHRISFDYAKASQRRFAHVPNC